MKKGNRVLALFLAVVMLATSIAWDFDKVDAAGNTSGITVSDDSVSFDFESITDVSVLDEYFTAHIQNVTSADESVATNWFSGKTASDADASNVNGLKLKKRDGDKTAYLKYKEKLDDFMVSLEMYPDANTMLVVGTEPATGSYGANANDFMAWFSSPTQLNWRGAGYGQVSNSSFTAGTPATVNIRVEDGKLTAWVDGTTLVANFDVGSAYPNESYICLRQKRNSAQTSDGIWGGYKSLKIVDLDKATDIDFRGADPASLSAKGFTSTRFDRNNSYVLVGDAEQSVENHWFITQEAGKIYSDATRITASNIGLKPNSTDADKTMTLLNTPYEYENFRVSTEVYWGASTGIVIGEKNVYPTNDDVTNVFRVYFNADQIQLAGGGLDYSTATIDGGTGHWDPSFETTYIFKPDSGFVAKRAAVYKLNVEVMDGVLSVWVDGYNSVLKVAIADTMTKTNVALMARQYDSDGGGLRSFKIEELESELENYPNNGTTVGVDGYTDFDRVDVAQLEAKGFKSTRFNSSDYSILEEDQSVSQHWFAGKLGTSTTGSTAISFSTGLKPNTAGSSYFTVLNTPYTAAAGYENYRISTEVYWGAATSIVLGEKNAYPSSTSNTVRIYFNANQIQVAGGGIDPNTAVVSGGATWSAVYAPTYIFKPASDFTVSKDAVYKLNVEMQNGTLTVWVDGYDGVLSLNTKKTFANEGIALGARQYDGDGGGFKSLTVKKLSEDIVIPYTADEFAEFRSADGHQAPTYKHYLFAGWYTDAACDDYTKAVPYNAMTTDAETVYAKFVPRYVMTVKAQISAELLDDNLKNDATGQIRFATTVDSENYSLAGFKVSYDKDGDGTPTDVYSTSKTVWTELTAIGNTTYEPEDFCQTSKYFKTCVVKPFEDTYFDMEFEVTPCWRTLDGTYVYGDTVVKTVNQGINTEALDGKTALFLGDSIQDGGNIEGEDAKLMAWYQRLAHYYGMVTEEVSNKGWALTNIETSGRGQIVTQLENAKQASYDFVILEGGVNDVSIAQNNADIDIDWGTINEDANATFTDDNIAGAMQDLIVKTQDKFPNADIVYIINHYFGATEENMEKYVAMVKAACRVHDISYVDLSDVDAYPSLAPLTKKSEEYIPDNLHPNAAGYELSTPVIANHLRKILTGELVDTVYVASTGTDAKGYGTETEPYQTLNYAMAQIEDGGTLCVQDALTLGNGSTEEKYVLGVNGGDGADDNPKVNDKQVTIAGANENAKLDVSGEKFLFLNTSVILENIQVAWSDRILAEGNTFIVKDTVEQVGSKEPILMGGSSYHDLEKTDLRVFAGTYSKIVGGQQKNTVGETNVIVGGKVNEGVDITTHDHTRVLIGGNYSEGGDCTVSGDTNVIVEQGARFDYVFGAGAKAQNVGDDIVCAVQGDTNVTFAGEAYGVYGGACGRLTGSTDKKVDCVNTNVTILEGAKVAQVFGGSEHASISGNANVNLLGGTISRRVWGGCYNEEEPATYYANGTVTVTISPDATLNTWGGMSATSRYNETSSSTETGIFIFTDYTNNSTNIGEISSAYEADKTHDHLVKVGANGTVKVVDGKLVVTPNSEEYTATVTGADINEDGTYTMTAKDIVVTFN